MTLQEKIKNAQSSNNLFESLTNEEKAYEDFMAMVSVLILRERQKRKMNQKQFAEFMNVSQSMVSKWESTTYNFTIKSIISILTKLDIKMDFIDKTTLSSMDKKYQNFRKERPQTLPIISMEHCEDDIEKYGNVYYGLDTSKPSMQNFEYLTHIA